MSRTKAICNICNQELDIGVATYRVPKEDDPRWMHFEKEHPGKWPGFW